MENFNVPVKNEVNEINQGIFDSLENKLGFVPNLYATFAHSESALADFLALSSRKSTLNAKEKEVISLVVSQINGCSYCLAAHTAIGKMNGFTDDQILDIRQAKVSFDTKLDALAKFVKSAVINRSKPSAEATQQFLNADYTTENVIDTMVVIGEKTITNFIHGTTQIPVDFPAAPELELVS